MKRPAPPPDIHALERDLLRDPAKFVRVLTVREGARSSDPYLPWDKLRHKQPPEGLTIEEWWFAIKSQRAGMLREVDLLDTSGAPFQFALPDALLRAVDRISQEASGHLGISEQVTNRSTRDRYVVSSLIEESITSSQLEGASTTRRVATDMLRSGRHPRDKSERMIVNNYRAMRRIGQLRNADLTPEMVCEIHRIVTEGTLDDPAAAGRIQDNLDPADRVAVLDTDDGRDRVLHQPPPVAELEERLLRLCDFANASDEKTGPWVPPVLRALTIHFMVGYDHYFEDGNGRTARALFYWSMLRQGFWVTEYLTISRILKDAPSKYAGSFLLTEQDGGDLTYFFDYHLKVVQRAIDDLNAYIARKVAEVRAVHSLLAAAPGAYNHRQIALLEHAIKTPDGVFTVESHGNSHNIAPETSRRDLLELERCGFLQHVTVKRRHVWSPVPNLVETMKDSY